MAIYSLCSQGVISSPQDANWHLKMSLDVQTIAQISPARSTKTQQKLTKREKSTHTHSLTHNVDWRWIRERSRERERGTRECTHPLITGPLHHNIRLSLPTYTNQAVPHPNVTPAPTTARDLNEPYPNSSAQSWRDQFARCCCCSYAKFECALRAPADRVFILPISATNHLDWAIKNYNPPSTLCISGTRVYVCLSPHSHSLSIYI